jgi:hypothetical protein
MTELLIIRFGFFKINTKSIIEFQNMPVCYTTSPNPMIITPGIYTSPPNDFTNTTWFDTNKLYLEKRAKEILQKILSAYTITQITIL